MTHRLSPLLITLALAGCAGAPPAGDDALARRVADLEARLQGQAGASLVGELARKLEALSADQERLRAQVQTLPDADRVAVAERRIDGLNRELAGGLQAGAQAGAVQAQAAQQREGDLAARVEALGADLRQTREALNTRAGAREVAQALGAAEQRLGGAVDGVAAQGRETDARVAELTARVARLEQRLNEVAKLAEEALEAVGYGQRKIYGKVLSVITLTQDRTLFPINSPELGDQDRAQLDALVPKLKELGTNYHLHIEGHTDGLGPDDYNYQLGKARAEVVRRYLNEKWNLPLLRMSVTSHGATAPLAGKATRRIVVQVLQ